MNALCNLLLRDAITPALAMLPKKMDSDEAKVQLLAITLQEARGVHRRQITRTPNVFGPANGLWQFEQGGAVSGVMHHWASKEYARELCLSRNCPWEIGQIWSSLAHDDVLAAGFARLLLYTDPKALPQVTSSHQEAWDTYVWNWRPGKPHRETWDEFRNDALEAVLL